MYRIRYEARVRKELDSIPDRDYQRIEEAIATLKVEPRLFGIKKIGPADWRIRIGNYRVLYEIDDKTKVVTIYRVKHRKDVYR
ncbi:MAG: type II toxin-antitoxin system RelE/ParE family toxin [bacterium]|nr:type II toxin-antitoxin system RelE/ParE family toxin [bacterium]